MQQDQGFATGISRPRPAQHEDVPEAPAPQARQDQGLATGISRPRPAQHEDVPEARGPKRGRTKASPPASPDTTQPSTGC